MISLLIFKGSFYFAVMNQSSFHTDQNNFVVEGAVSVSRGVKHTVKQSTVINSCRCIRSSLFQIHGYCLSRDVLSSLRRPNVEQSVYQTPPLLVMNNFSGDSLDTKLMATMFQNMVPSIDVNTVSVCATLLSGWFSVLSIGLTVQIVCYSVSQRTLSIEGSVLRWLCLSVS